ncbi:Chemoreceptor glutamine deamidase CheD [Peribacillus sp. Bi96]|uniref:chemotaxis protein CheD n=1 Tax=Peribacillus sp. Bi96 TaxID=2884273 RepID=UPI001D344412|nr:chemotaxis protein CheD [Peribacillus sp. Bi96]CAH0213429.1 Chemoreceptor glutamine deamidase CheD [Peribacillus sp. Bi96]
MTDLLHVKVVKVGIADMNIIKPPHSIRTSGLGSCVGLVIYDEKKGIAGLAHVMLPDSSLAKSGQINVAKFADTAVKELVHLLVKEGARMPFLKAKLAGGAQMFQFASGGDLMRIGPRNVDAVKKELLDLRIQVVAEDVGGNSGRTIEFKLNDCLLNIRTVNKGTKSI